MVVFLQTPARLSLLRECSELEASRTEIILVRHGETDWNAEGRIQGHHDTRLNRRGLNQAAAVDAALAAEGLDRLISSDLSRALDTARAIAASTGLSVDLEPDLREWDLGVLVGLDRTQAAQRQPHANRIRARRSPTRASPVGRVSGRERMARVIGCVERVVRTHPGVRLCIVTHGGPVHDCYCRATRQPPGGRGAINVHNGGISRIRVERGQWRILDWDATAHLAGVGALPSWVHSDTGSTDPK